MFCSIYVTCYFNGLVLYDDINKCSIPGIEQYKDIVDVENVWPITFVELLVTFGIDR
jgi:hypothetical protein